MGKKEKSISELEREKAKKLKKLRDLQAEIPELTRLINEMKFTKGGEK